MLITILKSKIHRATVTECNVDYEGSIAIDKNLLVSAKIARYEKIDIYNINNGERFSTYAIQSSHPGEICVNGAAARKVSVGDKIIIASYFMVDYDEDLFNRYEPIVVKVDDNNRRK